MNNKTNNEIKFKIHASLFKRSNANNEDKELLNISAFILSESSYNNNLVIKYIFDE